MRASKENVFRLIPRAFAFAARLYDNAEVLLESSEGIFYRIRLFH